MDLPVQGLSYEWNHSLCLFWCVSCVYQYSFPVYGQCSIAWICHLFLHHTVVDIWVVAIATMTYQRMLLSSQLPTAPDHTCDQIHVWPLLASPRPTPSIPATPIRAALASGKLLVHIRSPLCTFVLAWFILFPRYSPAPISTKMHVPTYHVL